MSSDIRTVTLIPGDGIGNYDMKAYQDYFEGKNPELHFVIFWA